MRRKIESVTWSWRIACTGLAFLLALAPCAPAVATDAAITKAMDALRKAAPRAAADPTRPVYHFRPPAQWMNDPCGGIYHKGYYHLFYQLNPYGDHWATIHWGHARNRDLVYWEHLPVALVPDERELRCNSGCVTINKEGVPMIFYTHVPNYKGPRDQRGALGDSDMISWKRHPANPILTLDNHGGPRFGDGWSDCFIFEEAGRTFMVIGVDSLGSDVAVPLYEAENAGYTKWAYRGFLFRAPRKEVRNMEVPMFFKLGGKWILLFHPSGPMRYIIGSFDLETLTFKPEVEGNLTHNYGQKKAEGVFWARGFSSPHVFFDNEGRCIIYGWISGFKSGRGWDGCLGLPRILTLGPDGRPRQEPAPELTKLRANRFGLRALELAASYVIGSVAGDTMEIDVTFEPGDAKTLGLKLRRSQDGHRAITISYDHSILSVAGIEVPLKLGRDETTLDLRIFLDKSVIEVFANAGREAVTKVIYPDENDIGIELFATGGKAKVISLDAWHMTPTNGY